jgi:hypothetical protein
MTTFSTTTLNIITLCHYAECRIFIVMPSVNMLSVVTLNGPFAECRYAECRYADCRYVECRYSECRYSECRYAECRYAECCTIVKSSNLRSFFELIF